MPVKKLHCPTSDDHGYTKPVRYYVKDETLDAFGEAPGVDDEVWTLAGSCYGNIKTGNGNEVYRAKKIDSDTDAVVKLPWNSTTRDYNNRGRFEINGRTYNILYVQNEDENNQTLIFGCRSNHG
jgi:SPP1 family predicted phage head-tail adaptor